jgi:hypothetical protein
MISISSIPAFSTKLWLVLTCLGYAFQNCNAQIPGAPSVAPSAVQSKAAALKKEHPSPCADAVSKTTNINEILRMLTTNSVMYLHHKSQQKSL